MRFQLPSIATVAAAVCCLTGTSALLAQNSIQIFAPVNVRDSAVGTGYYANTAVFNSATLHLNCPASPVAKLSSTADGKGKLMVDNDIAITVTQGETATGPTNVCVGGAENSSIGIKFENCFTLPFENAAPSSTAGQNPDNLLSLYGVPAINIGSLLLPGDLQVKVDLQDEGGALSNSTLYLDTNCTQAGVIGPALISGNPISSNNPSSDQLSQDFTFNPTSGQGIGFEYDLTAAQAAGSLTITDNTIPEVGDMPLDPALYQSQYAPGTSYATSSCFIHSGELLPNGQPACKLYTLECKVGTGATATGAECPISSLPNEVFNDVFDGPAFTLPDIPTPGGATFHTGIGLIMAKEGWTGGPCAFDPAANLEDLDCPQNLLTSFSSVPLSAPSSLAVQKSGKLSKPASAAQSQAGLATRARALSGTSGGSATSSYTSSGRTTHPNSTFLSIYGVPEPLTTVTIQGAYAGTASFEGGPDFPVNWVKGSPVVTFSTQPPNLAGVNVPGAAGFVPSPIASLNYEVGLYFPFPNFPYLSPGDPAAYPFTNTVNNTVPCPAPSTPTMPAATTFNPPKQTLGSGEGTYVLYYYAQDCAGTEELQYNQDGSGNWSASFYAVPIGVDNTPPEFVVTQQPPQQLQLGDSAGLEFYCRDDLSGVATCGDDPNGVDFGVGLDTSSPGLKTVTLYASDHVGNKAIPLVFGYNVAFPQQTSSVQISLSATALTYPGVTNATVKVGPSNQNPPGAPVGQAQIILDGQTLLAVGPLSPSGHGFSSMYAHLTNLPAGHHTLQAVNPGGIGNVDYGQAGTSAPVAFDVQPAPVTLSVSCVNPGLPSGANFSCNVYTKPVAAGAPGTITYRYDNGAPVTVTLAGGTASFVISKPPVGAHSVVITYPAQGNYAAATPQTFNFTVAPKH